MRAMVVDDESMTRESLYRLIPWRALGIDEVILAADGEDALAQAGACPPDILLTDVRMPVMDGIDLARAFAARHPQCKVLFLSGYSDKDYLMTAIKLKASAYIEKPIDPDEVTEAIRETVAEILAGRRLRMQDDENTGLLRAGIMRCLLSGDPAQAASLAEKAGIMLYGAPWQAASAAAEGPEAVQAMLGSPGGYDRETHRLICPAGSSVHVLSRDGSQPPEELLADLAGKLGLSIHIGAASDDGSPEGASSALRNAQAAARCAFYFGRRLQRHDGSGSITISVPDAPDKPLSHPDDTVDMLVQTCDALRLSESASEPVAKNCLHKLALAIAGDAALLRIPLEPLSCEPGKLWEWIDGFQRLSDAEQALTGAVHLLAAQASRSAHTRETIRYINENLCDYDLSVTKIAASLNLNASYLCTLFKDETGGTVGQYITDARLEKAKALLSGQRMQIRDVAMTVGYADTAWFVKRFRQAAGMTPSEYREKYGR